VLTKEACVHSVGSRDFSAGNSNRSVCDVVPFRRFTSQWKERRINLAQDASSRFATGPISTLRRYFGHQTTWYLLE
jgi:hypothetical protein